MLSVWNPAEIRIIWFDPKIAMSKLEGAQNVSGRFHGASAVSKPSSNFRLSTITVKPY